MFCKNCGSNIDDGALFCKNCGMKVESNYGQGGATYYTPPTNNNTQDYSNNNYYADPNLMEKDRIIEKGDQAETLGIVGLIVGILFSSIIGIILGAFGYHYASDALALTGMPTYKSAKSISMWAIIISVIRIVALILSIICLTIFASAFSYMY